MHTHPQAAADTLAISSLEVDLSNVEEGQTVTVKWRGKPVFIKHRTDADIADSASVLMKDLKDPQTDADRTVDPKVSRNCCPWLALFQLLQAAMEEVLE